MHNTIPYSLKGKVIIGRSQAGRDLRIKDEPWQRQQAVSYNHTTGPIGYGRPLTPQEQKFQHRGTYEPVSSPQMQPIAAVGGRPVGQQFEIGPFGWMFIGFIGAAFLFTVTGRSILRAAGYRVSKKIRG